MKPWCAFYPDVMPFIGTEIPDPMVDRQLLRAAQAFCLETRAWRVHLDGVRTQSDEATYDLELPRDAELVRIESVSVGEGDVLLPGVTAREQAAFTLDGKRLHLAQPVADAQTVQVEVSLQPGACACGVEDFLFDRHADVMAAGAIARLTGDAARQEYFFNACARVRHEVWRGHTRVAPRAQANWF